MYAHIDTKNILFEPERGNNMNTNGLLIIGMHRSGTSCLAGSLQQAGLYSGDVIESAPFNKKGNRENLDIMTLNTAVLQYSGGDWDNPPSSVSWSNEHSIERNNILQTLSSSSNHTWGFKDPRTMFTLPFWQEGIKEFRLVASYRSPIAVARSLSERNKFSIDTGLGIWKKYNLRLLEYLQKKPFPLISFDVSKQKYLDDLKHIIEQLGLNDTHQQETFYESSLKHQDENESINDLPSDIRRVYNELNAIYLSQSGQ